MRSVYSVQFAAPGPHICVPQQRLGQPFWDPQFPRSHFANSLPEPLRLHPNGVQPIQAAVYEDFGEIFMSDYPSAAAQLGNKGMDAKRRLPMSRPGSTGYPRNDQLPASIYGPSPVPDQNMLAQAFLTHQEAMDRFTVRRISQS